MEWDGLIDTPLGLLPPEQVQAICANTIRMMETSRALEWMRAEDRDAKRTPIGGRQFRYDPTYRRPG
jgi:hypothetical protein